VLGYSIQGSDELADFSFLWTIWMGISLAARRGAMTVMTLVSARGPAWWRRSLAAFSGVSLAVLLVYACVRSTQYAMKPNESLDTRSPGLGVAYFYPIASMTVGYYFITVHYLQRLLAAAARTAAGGRAAARDLVQGALGGLAVAAAVWVVCWVLLEVGAPKLLVLGVIFVALTLAGTPIVFMLLIVGIVSTMDFLGLSFYPDTGIDPLLPFRTTQNTMGLSGSTGLVVILMFLVVAAVMNASGMSNRLIRFAAACVGHLRGGMAYVCQLTSLLVSGISGSAQADAAIMTPLLVPAMEREGYPRDVASAVVAGASIKGPIGPLSIMFIAYGVIVSDSAGASIQKLLLSGIAAVILLFLFQAATVYVVARRMGFLAKRPFAGVRAVGASGARALPVLAIPVIILGGILGGVFTPSESASVAVVVTLGLALFWYSSLAPRSLAGVLVGAAVETGIVMLLLGDSSILARVLELHSFGQDVQDLFTGLTDNKYVFLLVVNLFLLAVGIFVEPLPALFIIAPFLAPVAVDSFGVDPVQFGLIMVFNLVLALIHPPIGLVLFLVSSISRVSVERLSVMILPWLAVSLIVLFLVTYLPSEVVLAFSNLIGG
jgi:tripartite ATP-independent transporter DctM subunit